MNFKKQLHTIKFLFNQRMFIYYNLFSGCHCWCLWTPPPGYGKGSCKKVLFFSGLATKHPPLFSLVASFYFGNYF